MTDTSTLRHTVAFSLASCVAACTLGGCGKSITDRDIKRTGITNVRNLVAESEKKPEGNVLLLVDPRSAGEFAEGHIPGARNIQLSQVPPDRKADPLFFRYKNVIVYGRDPGSAVAKGMTKRLLAADVDDVLLFPGGLDEWVRNGGALGKGASPAPAR